MVNNQMQDDKKYYGRFSVVYARTIYDQDQFILDIDKVGNVKLKNIKGDKVEKHIKKADFMSNRLYKNMVVYCLMSNYYDRLDLNLIRLVMEE